MRINKKSIGLLVLFFTKQGLGLGAETLEQAFAEAVNKNQRISAAQANSQAAEQQIFAAQGQRMPQLNVSGGYTQLSETPSAQTNVEGRPAQFPVSTAGSANAQAIISLPVFTSGRISHSIEAAEAAALASQHDETTTILNIKLQVANAFIAIFRAEKALQVAQSHVVSLKAHAKDVRNLYDQGMVARNDWLAADVELSNAEQQVLQQENSVQMAKANFNQLLNRDLTANVELIEQFPEIPQGDYAALSQQALLKRAELSGLAEQVHALEQQAASVKAGLWPQVNVSGGYQYTQNQYQTYEGIWMANATVQWQIYDGSTAHRSDALIRQALAVNSQRNDLISAIQLQVRQAWLAIQETQKRVIVTQQATGQADENLKVSTERYQQGLAGHTEVLDAESLRIRTYDNFNNARYDAVMANLNLRRALGIL
ncbi:MAG: TolC family protein [Methyloprofundus sp.]|nr:TolC family protein [Methyloprofundus sp.]MDT8425546.1 TolC family protein [Methyloprofundus sp.]